MKNLELIKSLKSQETLVFIFRIIVTLGLYIPHYLLKMIKTLNPYLNKDNQLSMGVFNLYFVLYYFLYVVALFILGLIFTFTDPLQYELPLYQFLNGLLVFLHYTILIGTLIYVFKIRNRIHEFCEFDKGGDKHWMNILWLVVFQIYYLNYKINKIYRIEFGNSTK